MKRYLPQTRLAEIGKEGQKRLSESHVLVVGCGALGSPLVMYLAGAGVGHITIADFDTVDLTNLHRQVFYTENEIGKMKAECLKQRMISLNSEVKVDIINKFITRKTLESLNEKPDLIIDAADNPATTYLLDDYCKTMGIPLSTAGVSEWKAQVFFYYPGCACFSDVFSRPENESGLLPCSIAGITGPVASFAASIQALDVIKFLVKVPGTETSRLLSANLLEGEIDTFKC